MSKIKSIRPLRSTSKLQIHRTSRKHVQNQTIGPLGSSIRPLGNTYKLQTIRPLGSTSKTSNTSDLWEACPKFKITTEILILSWPLVSMSCTHFFPQKKQINKQKQKKKKATCMNYVWTWSSHQKVCRQSPLRFSPHFDPLHDGPHSYLHSPQSNIDCKVRCLFHTLTFALQALSMKGILLTPYFATRI